MRHPSFHHRSIQSNFLTTQLHQLHAQKPIYEPLNHVRHYQACSSDSVHHQPAPPSKYCYVLVLLTNHNQLIPYIVIRCLCQPPCPKTRFPGRSCSSPSSKHSRTDAAIRIHRKDVEQVRPVVGTEPKQPITKFSWARGHDHSKPAAAGGAAGKKPSIHRTGAGTLG